MKSLALLTLLVAVAGCVTTEAGQHGTQSLKVELITPTDPGTPDNRLQDSVRQVVVKVTAIDDKDQTDTTFNGNVDVYVEFLGTLTPDLLTNVPLTSIPLSNGVSANATINLPSVFGPTIVWIQDGSRTDATFATGTSPTLWFRDPFMVDVSKPVDETMLPDALDHSPLENKQVTVNGSRYGAKGRLVVTSVFAQGYTVSDVQCADASGTPPCTTGDYDAIDVFSFSRPTDTQGRNIQEGEVIDGWGGGVEEFDGLTEIGFPQTFVSAQTPEVNPARIPPPTVFQMQWLNAPINLERNESFLLEIDNAKVCPLDSDYAQYKQWKLDVGFGCGSPINVITSGVLTFDPSTAVGNTLHKVVGSLRPVNIGSFNVWIIYPREEADLVP